LKIKEQETHPIFHEHDDDDDDIGLWEIQDGILRIKAPEKAAGG
jgi:hypothetical protein